MSSDVKDLFHETITFFRLHGRIPRTFHQVFFSNDLMGASKFSRITRSILRENPLETSNQKKRSDPFGTYHTNFDKSIIKGLRCLEKRLGWERNDTEGATG